MFSVYFSYFIVLSFRIVWATRGEHVASLEVFNFLSKVEYELKIKYFGEHVLYFFVELYLDP